MAKIGMKYPRYAKITVTEGDNGAESETYGTVKTAGRAISANITTNISDEKFYADDNVAETDPEFIDGSVALSVDEMTAEVISDLTGASLSSGTGGTGDLTFSADDAAPYVRFGFVVPMMVRGVKKWIGIVFLRVKFGPPDDSYQTKGQNIQFQGTTINGDIMKNANGCWKMQSAWKDTEAAAVTWLDANLAPTP